jgi:serine/threonine protein phosphatase PrpC
MASSLVVRTLYDAYMANQTDPIPTVLGDAVLAANSRIYEYGISRPELRGMGSTCTALVVRGTDAWFAHVGDSRLYLVRENRILQLTDDHSKVAQMVRDGQMTEAEAEESTQRNVLQRALGPKGRCPGRRVATPYRASRQRPAGPLF